MKTEKPKIALFAQTKDEPDHNGGRDFTIDVSLCCIPDDGQNYPRGMRDSEGLDNLHFIIRGGSCAHRMNEGKSAFHDSVSICYNDVFYMQLAEVEAKAKTLRSIHRKLEIVREKMGYAAGPFELLGRFAETVKAHGIYFRNNQAETMRTGEKFRFLPTGGGIDRIRHEARAMAESLTPAGQSAAA